MYFLVDFENVAQRGLTGMNLLTKEDTVIFFYNGTDRGLSVNNASEIITKATIEGIKLVRQGKNGLDFYIGIMIGEILAKNPNEKIAIISNDNGYVAVYDYCKTRFKRKIIITKDICNAINIANNNISQESDFITVKKEVKISFEQLIDNQKKLREMESKKELNEELCNVAKITVNEEDLELVDIYNEVKVPFKMYNSLVHKFGKTEGRRIYTLLASHKKEKSM